MYKQLIRPVLFTVGKDPEVTHEIMMQQLALVSHIPVLLKIIDAVNAYHSSKLARDVFGIHFPNPLGLAAGFDKNGRALPALAALGFGFIEAGGVTRYAQTGQPRQRIFRLTAEDGLINRMGLPNGGAAAIASTLTDQPKPAIPIGWQLAKSKITPLEEAIPDYLFSLKSLYPHADYFTVNVSSPNTPGLVRLQEKEPLRALLQAIVTTTKEMAAIDGQSPKPVLVKLSPDLEDGALDDALEAALSAGVRGIIATNTTVTRSSLKHPTIEVGGLSGRPLTARSLAVVKSICERLQGAVPVIGVGGIFGPDDARRMFDAGAALIQIYTSFIYEGPGIIKRINRSLAQGED